jgi:osmotically-inducible protein OsmY
MVVADPRITNFPALEARSTLGVVPQLAADEACQSRIQDLLHGARPEFRQLRVTSQRGTVTMSGRVSSFYLRQLAIRCCQQAAGAFHINDQLQVGTA